MRSALLCAALLGAALPGLAAAASTTAGGSGERTAAVARPAALVRALAARINAYYVDPAAAGVYRRALDQALAEGALDGLAGEALAARLTATLRAARPDLHLSIYAPGTGLYGKEDASGQPSLPDNSLEAAGWIAPGIAYLRPFAFFNRAGDVDRVQAFMDAHAGADALIIDLRRHHGGELPEMDVILADLFAAPTDLLTMTTRPAAWDRFEKKPPTTRLSVVARDALMVREMHRAIPRDGGARMASIPVFVLTARRTASAGEHFALAMKTSGRATLVGEATRGAGHYGDQVELLDGFSMFIPYGDTVDPKTGKGWEATGVTPHVALPAAEALDHVLATLGRAKAASPYPSLNSPAPRRSAGGCCRGRRAR